MLATNGFCNKIIWNNNKYKKTYETIKSVPLLETGGINVPVVIGGVQIKPGDLIVGDDTGIIVIPANKAEEVLKVAQKIQRVEGKIVKHIQEGIDYKECRKLAETEVEAEENL